MSTQSILPITYDPESLQESKVSRRRKQNRLSQRRHRENAKCEITRGLQSNGLDFLNADLANITSSVQPDASAEAYPRIIEHRQDIDSSDSTLSQAMLEFTAGPSGEVMFSPDFKPLSGPSDLLFSLEHGIPDTADEMINLIGNDEGNTPLHEAVIYGRHTVVKTLINRGADPLATNMFGKTPLHLAAEFGRYNVIEIMDPGQSGLDVRDKFGSTPLHLAAKAGHEQVVALLLDKGAGIDTRIRRG